MFKEFYTLALAALLGIVIFWTLAIWVPNRDHHDQWSVWCQTNGAHMNVSSHDHDLHITFWCTKNGKLVP